MDGCTGRAKGRSWGLWLVVLPLMGCSMSPGGRFTPFPEGHRLLDSARCVRQPEPLPLPRELDKQVLPPYVVEPGDVLLVQPADVTSPLHLPADQPVLPDGTINLGRFGQIVVAGKTITEIESLAREAVRIGLAQDKAAASAETGAPPAAGTPSATDPFIVVRVLTRNSKVYYILGEVNTPGAFPLSGRETVLDGILAAGGLTDRASRRNIILSRPTHPDGCRMVLPICYREIVQLGDTTTNYQLAPGDRIFVATRGAFEGGSRKEKCGPCGRPQFPCPPPLPEEACECHLPALAPHGAPLLPAVGDKPLPADTGLLTPPRKVEGPASP